GPEARLGEESQMVRAPDPRPHSAMDIHARPQPGKPFFRLAIFHESAAANHHRAGGVKRKDLLGRKGERGLCPLEAEPSLAAPLMNHRRDREGHSLAQGVSGGASSGDRFFRVAKCLIGIALIPEDERQKGVTDRAGVVATTGGVRARAPGIVKREGFFQMAARRYEIAEKDIELANGGVSVTEE